jgi:hypothetical protein
VDWSYDLLEPAEQLAFARLSVFAGGFTLEAAEAVLADGDRDRLEVVDILGGLVSKSMVVLEERVATVPYRLLDTMRDYAADRLDELDDPDRVADRHAQYYVELAEQAAPHIVGTDDAIWTRRLEAEHDNLHTALTWVREHDPARLTQLARALAQFWSHQRHIQEGFGWISTALDLDLQMSSRVRAELEAAAGSIAINLSLIQRGDDLLRESLATSSSFGDGPSAQALVGFSIEALVTNRSADARRYVEEALARATAEQEPNTTEVDSLSQCSIVISLTSDDPRGLELADQAIATARHLGNSYSLGAALQAGGIARYRDDPAGALTLLDESLMVSNDAALAIRDQALLFKGLAHARLREHGQAAQAFDAALALHHAAGAEYYQTMVLAAIAGLFALLGSTSIAVKLLAVLAHLREEGRIVGSPRDLAMQERLRDRLQQTVRPDEFAELSAAGGRLTLDDAVTLARNELRQVTS